MTRIEARDRQRFQEEFLHRFKVVSSESTAMFHRGMDTIEVVECSEGALATFGEHIEAGAVPVIATNHTSLFDGFVVAKLADDARKRSHGVVEKFDLVIAQSLASGKQQEEANAYFSAVKPFLREYGVEMDLSIPTENDVHYRQVKREKRDYLQDYLEVAPQEGLGFAIFPEGTVRGGKRNPTTGIINGMRLVKSENDMTRFIDAVRAKGHDVVVLLGGIDGADQMINPDTIFPADAMLSYLLGYADYPTDGQPIRVVVGEPVVIWAGTEPTDGKELAQKIANLLPPHRKGVWA